MNRRLVLLASFFLITPFFLVALIFYQLFLFHQDSQNSSKTAVATTVKYGVLPSSPAGIKVALTPHEGRVDVLKEFFARYNSPLVDYAQNIVEAADKYKLDYRLLPAIAMQESTLCLKAPKGINNCWGFGIYGKKKTSFESLAAAIEVISKTISRDYHGRGLIEPAQIMTRYTPANTNGWAEKVSYVMERIDSQL